MSTPVSVTTAGGQVLAGKVSRPDRPVNPSAIAQQVPSAAYGIAQVLKDLIHSSRAYHSENQVLEAYKAVETFMKAFIPASALPALLTGDERAPIEDVSKRIPPSGVAFSVPTNVPVIDYDKLALAMVRAQAAYQAEVQSVPEPPAEPEVYTPEYSDGADA
jgi:hypothetical protein